LGSNKDNPIEKTLQPLYSGSSDIGHILVSDQPPSGISVAATRAHMKGVFLYDQDNGVYLVHSVPRFPIEPETSKSYQYPDSGVNNGQSFLCLTLSHEDMEKIMKTWLVDYPFPYSTAIPSFSYSKIPSIQNFMNGVWNNNDMTLINNVKAGSQTFTVFGKHRKWGLDIYHDLLAPTFKSNIFANTWSNGVGTNPSDCSGNYAAYNVLALNWGSISWPRSKDHSKWGLASTNVCIGGINRQESQKRRGGSAFCIQHSAWSKEMNNLIEDYEKCS